MTSRNITCPFVNRIRTQRRNEHAEFLLAHVEDMPNKILDDHIGTLSGKNIH